MHTRSTPRKSNTSKSNTTKSTPMKRKLESFSGENKKLKFDTSLIEEKCKSVIDQSPSFVLSMGSGDTGQLGLGEDIMERKRPAEISNLNDIIVIRAGGMHSVCLSISGDVYTFGCNDDGALGRTIIEDEEATVPGRVELPADVVVIDITAGDSHSSVLTSNRQVYIWGCFRDNNGPIGLMKPSEKLLVPTLVPTDRKIIKVASGENHIAMLTDTGEILTFGCAEQGQLGRISPNNLIRGGRGGLLPLLVPAPVRVRHNVKFCDIWAGAFCTVGKSIDNEVYGCGLNNYHQLGEEDELIQIMMTSLTSFNKLGESWSTFAFGQHHTVALTKSNKIFVVGRGEYGSLGLGDNEHHSEISQINLIPAEIKQIAACNRTSYALMTDGTIYSWGAGNTYQLGHGDDEDVNVPTKMVGKQLTTKKVIEISPGGQHVIFRAIPLPPTETVLPVNNQLISAQEMAPIKESEITPDSDIGIIESPHKTMLPEGSIVVPMDVIIEVTPAEEIKTLPKDEIIPMDIISEENETENVSMLPKDETVSMDTSEVNEAENMPILSKDEMVPLDVIIEVNEAENMPTLPKDEMVPLDVIIEVNEAENASSFLRGDPDGEMCTVQEPSSEENEKIEDTTEIENEATRTNLNVVDIESEGSDNKNEVNDSNNNAFDQMNCNNHES